MNYKHFILSIFLLSGISGLFAAELSGTYDKDFRVTTSFNTVAKGKTLHVTNGSTFIMADAIVHGNIIVDKGCTFISPDDYEGYLVFKQGAIVEGIDLYYLIRVSENLVYTRKIPMTIAEIWKSGNKEIIDTVENMEFCYSPALKGWVSMGEVRFVNPFNEDLSSNNVLETRKALAEVLDAAPPPSYTEISGTYKKDYTVTTDLNKVSKGKTLNVKKGATLKIQDLTVEGNIVVDKGGSFIAPADNTGDLVFRRGSNATGIDLYYKLRISNDQVMTRKIPMAFSDVWKSNNKELIECVENMKFSYSSALKGWIAVNEIRFWNPFNENLYEDYDMVFTSSVSQEFGGECRSIIVKNKSKVIIQPNKDIWGTRVNESIIIEKGSSLVGTGADGHKLVLKRGAKVEGLPLYIRFNNDYVLCNSVLSDLWKVPAFNKNDFWMISYKADLEGWCFEDIMFGESDLPDNIKKKLRN